MPTNRDEIKAICAMPMTGTAKLVAIAIVTFKTLDTNELAAITGESARTVQKARATYLELKDEPREPEFAERGETRESSEPEFAKDAKGANYNSPLAPASHARNEPPTGVVISKPVDSSSSSSPRTCASDEDDVASAMVKNICEWARMPEVNARQWLANTITVFGQEATARGYHTLKTKVASGEIVAKPLMFWTTTSRNEKDQAAKRREPPAKTKPTIREVLAARAAEAIQ